MNGQISAAFVVMGAMVLFAGNAADRADAQSPRQSELHAAIAHDETGEPKLDERGRTVYRVRRHDIEEFTDVVARNFRQPEEGLGWDDTPSSHMWRTLNWPTRFL